MSVSALVHSAMRAAGGDPECRVTPASIVGREAHPDPKPPAFQALAEGQFGAMQFRDASRDGQAEADALDSEADSARHGATRHAWRTNKKCPLSSLF